jgi:hypothetical protein
MLNNSFGQTKRRHDMKKKYFILLFMILGIVTYASSSFSFPVWFEPSSHIIQEGSNFDLTLIADNHNDPVFEAITGFRLQILFDPTLMTLDSIENINDPLWPVLNLENGNILDGGVGPFAVAFVDDELILAKLNFTCLVPGESEVSAIGAFDNGKGFKYFNIFSGLETYYNFTITPADVTQTPIPEPTTMLLFGSGLIGLVGFRRRFKK